jgi:hypothetical protein
MEDGGYVYVQDIDHVIHIMIDGPHHHVRVLGQAAPALYAGDLTIKRGRIADLTNLSGTFQFDDASGLLEIANAMEAFGFEIDSGAVRLFPIDGRRPIVLR